MICLLNHPSSFSNGNFGCLEYSDQSHALVSTWDLNRHVSKEWVVRRSLLLVRFACVTFNMQPPGWAVIEHYIHTFKRSARYPSKSAQLCKRRCFVSVWAALMVCRFPASVKNVKASKVNSLFPPFLQSPPHQWVCCACGLLYWCLDLQPALTEGDWTWAVTVENSQAQDAGF